MNDKNVENVDNSDKEEDRLFFDLWMKGDPKGFSTIYEKYKKRLFGFLIRMTGDRELAEDLMHETFFSALRNAKLDHFAHMRKTALSRVLASGYGFVNHGHRATS